MNTAARTLKLLEAIAAQLASPLGRETLPKSSDTKQATLQTTEEIARRLGILPPLVSDQDMATVTYTIGTTSRDYSTVSSWEADLDNGALYSSGDDAVGECYNDSAFDEFAVLTGGTTVGLSSRRLTAASADRHDGTAGSGARFVFTGNNGNSAWLKGSSSAETTVEWLEFDINDQNMRDGIDSVKYVNNCLIHDANSSRGNYVTAITKSQQTCHFLNNIIYELDNSNTGGVVGIEVEPASADVQIKNNTIHGMTTSSSGNCYGIASVDQSLELVQNNLITGCDTRAFEENAPSNATMDYNAADDTSAAGANSLNSITPSSQYVSLVAGSEDLHIKSGADVIDEGIDLGTTPVNVNIDINGRDRDAEGDTWDIGAHEFVGGAPPATSEFPFQIYYG